MADNTDVTDTATTDENFIIDETSDEVLRLHLDKFEGPFDVLLYLIKSQEIDIFDIPIVKITEQYLRFLDLLREESLDVAGEFLVMAATLIQIKSRMLLPPDLDDEEDEEGDEEDPRLELVEKLLEYRKYRDLTRIFQTLEETREDWFARNVKPVFEVDPDEEEYIEATFQDLVNAFRKVLHFFNEDLFQTVTGEGYSVDEKIAQIEEILAAKNSVAWVELFEGCRNRIELVCYLLAILELCRMGRIRAHQSRAFGDIRLFAKSGEDEPAAIVE